MVNSSNSNSSNGVKRSMMPTVNQENQVLDPKKSQNIAILLRALNVTIDEVCDALLEGKIGFLSITFCLDWIIVLEIRVRDLVWIGLNLSDHVQIIMPFILLNENC